MVCNHGDCDCDLLHQVYIIMSLCWNEILLILLLLYSTTNKLKKSQVNSLIIAVAQDLSLAVAIGSSTQIAMLVVHIHHLYSHRHMLCKGLGNPRKFLLPVHIFFLCFFLLKASIISFSEILKVWEKNMGSFIIGLRSKILVTVSTYDCVMTAILVPVISMVGCGVQASLLFRMIHVSMMFDADSGVRASRMAHGH